MIGGKKRKKKQLKNESTFKKARRLIDSKASEDDDDSTDEEEASSDVSAESDESDVSGSDADNLDSVSILLRRCDQTTVKRCTSYLHVICSLLFLRKAFRMSSINFSIWMLVTLIHQSCGKLVAMTTMTRVSTRTL